MTPDVKALNLLAAARSIAQAREGGLISEQVPNVGTKLEWQCIQGHRWEARFSAVKRGSWCPVCSGNIPRTIEEMRHLAAEHRGVCLSAEYINGRTPLLWRCAEHHVWPASPGHIKRTWCPVCAGNKKLELKELRKIARRRRGRLLSVHYVNSVTPLKWMCANGHVWNASAINVKDGKYGGGSWCPECSRNDRVRPRLDIDDMRQIARCRGGECVSGDYVNCDTKLTWRCALGHEWAAAPKYVKHGTWCPVCGGKQKLQLRELQEMAAEREGKLLSSEYANHRVPLLWECAQGHQWQTTANSIRDGSWCPNCAGSQRLSLEEMQELAHARGGECLSKRYVNARTPLRWRCARGHVWKAMPDRVKPRGHQQSGTWCPLCAHPPQYTIADMEKLAATRGGECLSTTYINATTPLRWRCARGHVWEALANSILHHGPKGSWCQKCFNASQRLTIEEMRDFARSRGGECLSTEYVNSRTPLRWRCAKGHTWLAKPSKVKPYGPLQQGTWCPDCAAARTGEANRRRIKLGTR